MDTNLFIIACVNLLLIEKPVEIVIKPKFRGATKELAGYCGTRYRKGKLQKHVVNINAGVCFGAGFKLEDVIAHELVHAVMIENQIFNPEHHHDKRFQAICRELTKNLRKSGFTVGILFDPASDTD